jgi:hypothetical protein
MPCDCQQPDPNPCDPAITSPESVASQLSNLTGQLFGTLTKSIVDGRFVWNQPCQASLPFDIYGVTPTEGEGMLCYIIRALKAIPGVATLDIQVFADAAERAAAAPTYIGQPGIQLDTFAIYIATGVVAGDWNPFSLILANIPDGIFTADATGRNKFAAGFITASLIASATITDVQLAANCITTGKILDSAVTAAKLAGTLDLSGKTIILPALSVTVGMLTAALDLSGKTLTMPAGHWLNIAPSLVPIQVRQVMTSALINVTGGTSIGNDDTIPPDTEGTQILSQAITLSSASSKVLVLASVPFGNNSAGAQSRLAIFSSANSIPSNAIAACKDVTPSGGQGSSMVICYLDSPGVAGSVTYTARASDCYINAGSTSRVFGGVSRATLTLIEIK